MDFYVRWWQGMDLFTGGSIVMNFGLRVNELKWFENFKIFPVCGWHADSNIQYGTIIFKHNVTISQRQNMAIFTVFSLFETA